MIVKIERFESGRTRNINGKVISREYRYVIYVRRHWWNIRKRYLRVTHDWFTKLIRDNEPCQVELTRSRNRATTFRTAKILDFYNIETAKKIVAEIKKNQDNFILN